jgi:hypothetical protein
MVCFVGVMTWGLHSGSGIGWDAAALLASAATLACGGTALLVIALIMRSSYRRLATLTIPRDGSDLEFHTAEEPSPEQANLVEGLKWMLVQDARQRRLTIRCEMVVAVQLCPWKLVIGEQRKSITWAVQGLLVLGTPAETTYQRLPLLLTGDCVGAARLMGSLAHTLQVPFLFCADAAGWEAETVRAKTRPPLRAGGIVS